MSGRLLRGKNEFYKLSRGKEPKLIEPIRWTNFIHPQSKIVMVHRICVLTSGIETSASQNCHYDTAVQARYINPSHVPSRLLELMLEMPKG